MAKFIYYTDLHYGPDVPPYDEDGVHILGSYASRMHEAVLEYAEKEGIQTILHGGDETTFHPIKEKWLERAFNAASLMQEFNGDVIRVLGNHDYRKAPHLLGFQTNSFVTRIDGSLPACILQPSYRHNGQKWLYAYSERTDERLETYKDDLQDQDHLIVAGHWAFDRVKRGYPDIYEKEGYIYKDRSDVIQTKLQKFNIGHILTLHGHEHRFALSENLSQGNGKVIFIQNLTMPSIVQHDINDQTKPCGLFVIIDDENRDGKLSLHFKKVVISDDRKTTAIRDVTRQEMKAYKRPVRFDSEHNVPKYKV